MPSKRRAAEENSDCPERSEGNGVFIKSRKFVLSAQNKFCEQSILEVVMEKENTAQNPKSAAAGAEARRETVAAANLGKFKSVDALLNAYNSLHQDFLL